MATVETAVEPTETTTPTNNKKIEDLTVILVDEVSILKPQKNGKEILIRYLDENERYDLRTEYGLGIHVFFHRPWDTFGEILNKGYKEKIYVAVSNGGSWILRTGD